MENFIGQIMLSGFGFAPRGFAACNGQLLPINQNQALFSLLGTMYGGDGQSTFALPNLQGRTPVHAGASADPGWQPAPYAQGTQAGVESVALQVGEMAPHNHLAAAATTAGAVRNPTNALYAASGNEAIYAPASGLQVALGPQTLASSGNGTAHVNMQSFRVLNFSIALTGIFPSRN